MKSGKVFLAMIVLLIFLLNIFPANAKTAEDWVKDGKILYQDGMFSEALYCFNRALQIDPQNKEALEMKNNILKATNKTELQNTPGSFNSNGEKQNTLKGIIVFIRDGDIYIINEDGTGEKRLTTTGKYSGNKWSPDGTKIIYGKWIYDVISGKNYKLDIGEGFHPCWTSDNNIIFIKESPPKHGGPPDRFLINKDLKNNTIKQIAKFQQSEERPVILSTSSNGLIFYTIGSGRGCGIYIMKFDGTEIEIPYCEAMFNQLEDRYRFFEDYNQEKSLLLFSFKTGVNSKTGLCYIDINKLEEVYIHTTNPYNNNLFHGKWTPDGNYLIAIDVGKNIQKLSNFKEDISVDYESIHPDKIFTLTKTGDIDNIIAVSSDKIFYTRKKNNEYYLWSIGLDGSNPEKITEGDFQYTDNIDITFCPAINKTEPQITSIPVTTDTSSSEKKELTEEILKNLTYNFDWRGETTKLLKFENGKYDNDPAKCPESDPNAPGYATIKGITFGDINGDNNKDAAVFFYWTGGCGGSLYLTVVLNENGEPVQVGMPLGLGRVVIDSITIKDKKIIIKIASSMDDSSLKRKCVTYKLKGEKLVMTNKTDY